eukprot:TRINITY_DN34589_c0_g1_i1.p1 TRINITY_DN34589_c0_g1~~TRINITY_DN34589_c0_g1_i1.p1  ORF type:complete len:146 (-),score=22.35 TRINITY_DN34589_c0_g1_i1:130-567(-)
MKPSPARRSPAPVKFLASEISSKSCRSFTGYFGIIVVFLGILLLVGTADARNMFSPPASRQRSEEEHNSLGCSSSPSLRILKYLDRICDDCYMLYRDSDVYQLCRSDCFSSRFFLGCMDVMMVSKGTRTKAAKFVTLINNYASHT